MRLHDFFPFLPSVHCFVVPLSLALCAGADRGACADTCDE
jgi:hypothetical protein